VNSVDNLKVALEDNLKVGSLVDSRAVTLADNSKAVISVDSLIRAEWAQVLDREEDLINNKVVEDFDCITGRGTLRLVA
jgi:hypothetical protein